MASIISKRNSFWFIPIGLTLSYLIIHDSSWEGSIQLHTIMESIATTLALFVGVMALVRYYSSPDIIFLLIGAGFLGTSFLDGYHAVVTSSWFKEYLPSDLTSLIPWSWIASRLYLAVMLWASYIVWKRVDDFKTNRKQYENRIYFYTFLTTLLSFLFFIFSPLPPAYYPDYIFHRPEEFIPAVFFALALYGYLSKGKWKNDNFEYWLVLSLIVNFVSQAVFMSHSLHLFDVQFDIAHLLKKVSYILVLTGLLISMFQTFINEREQRYQIQKANQQLETLSYIDGLTGVTNRRMFDIKFKTESERARRNNEELSILMLDIDHFKEFNDNYGHLKGDECIMTIAQELERNIKRNTDLLARYGGEEFIIMLPKTSIEAAIQLAESCRKNILKLQIPHESSSVSNFVTISVGVATEIPSEDFNYLRLLGAADKKLYVAKEKNRNRVEY
ncbi:MAG: GGDEF domain-containing protein [Gammaproteobacteria bacterium]|nr:GGDEF domain-containing protein [Gammaproteobacteria bacterium]